MNSSDAAAPPQQGRAGIHPALVVLALALLMGIQPVTTDLYLPALPALREGFGASMAAVQMTLSTLLVCFGLGQLVCGPLADQFGRRPVLLAGLALYVGAALMCAWAPSIGLLIAARGLQGVGMAAAVVCARAMVRDLYEPYQGTHVMSKALTGLGFIAISSPVLGGLLAAAFGWRAALLATGVFAAAALALIALRVPETARQLNPHATRPGPLLATFVRIARHPTFLAWTLLTSATYGGLLAFLAGSSFTYMSSFGLSRSGYGLAVASSSAAYVLGTYQCRRWLLAHGIRGAVRRGGLITLTGGVLYAMPALAEAHSLWSLLAAQGLYAFGHGIHQPCGQAGVVGPFAREAGSASALSGFVLSSAAFAMGTWLGVSIDGSVRPFALTIAAMALLTTVVALTLVQRHGEAAVRRP
jgi:DHA1 family bicyclomycin/chloramphenicol resistance-like MFS transporter